MSTNPNYGCIPERRPIQDYIRMGIINLDKPAGPTSHQVSAWVKQILNLKKVGHSGTLDPQTTGLLPIALENATKILQGMLQSNKEYITIMRLHQDQPLTKIKQICRLFVGEIYQRPPLRSSVKRQLRTRHIYSLKVLEKANKNVLFHVRTQAGVYVRKLIFDIGEVLGVGAHMAELRRVRSGPFSEEKNLVTLHNVMDAYKELRESNNEVPIRKVILPVESAITHLPLVAIRDSAVDAICHGASLAAPGVVKLTANIKPETLIAIITLKGELVALAKSNFTSKQISRKNHGLIAKTSRVIMKIGTYPQQ